MATKWIDSIAKIIPDLWEKSGKRQLGIQHSITVPLGPPLLVDGVTYVGAIFIAPCDGCEIVRLSLTAIVKIAGGTNTLAIDNYDASANAARNVLSTATVDPITAVAVAKEGSELTLSATPGNLLMDRYDVLNFSLVCGTMTTDGQGYAITATILRPEVKFGVSQ